MKLSIFTKVCVSIIAVCAPLAILLSIATVINAQGAKHYWAATDLYYQSSSAYYDADEEAGKALAAQANEESARGDTLSRRADQVIGAWPYVAGGTIVAVFGFWAVLAARVRRAEVLRRSTAPSL